ncbi:MAG: tRNA dihydrouridine(20/20a) synthase DusA, partial [Alphaproteobacteria bacterium]
PGARAFRRILSEQACRRGAGISVLHNALAAVQHAGQPQAVAAE